MDFKKLLLTDEFFTLLDFHSEFFMIQVLWYTVYRMDQVVYM